MTDVFLPLSVDVASVAWRYLDSTGVSRNPYNATARSASRGGDRVGVALEFSPAGGASAAGKQRRRRLTVAAMGMCGKQGRIVLTDPGYTPAGSFPTGELLTNNDFNNGINGWTAGAGTLSVSDGVGRLVSTAVQPAIYQNISLTQYVPYVLRAMITDGWQSSGLSLGPFITLGSGNGSNYSASRGLVSVAGVPDSASLGSMFPVAFASTTGYTAGAYVSIPWTSLSRCALADAGPNALLYSDQADNAIWTKSEVTVSANADTAPDGTATADRVTPSTNSTVHAIIQTATVSAATADFCFTGAFKSNGYDYVLLQLGESASSTSAFQMFNLNTGAIATTVALGAGWSGIRSHMVALGNGWYQCSIVARKITAGTTLSVSAYSYSSDSVSAFAGNGTSGLRMWRATANQSSVPVRLTQTTSAATAGTGQNGSALYLKGLPVSTQGLLLAGDWVEIITSLGSQLAMVMAALDSDAAGKAVLFIAPAIRGTVVDNAAVIIHKPMGRFISSADLIQYLTNPGIISTTSFDLEESPF